MHVVVQIQFEKPAPAEQDWEDLRSLARSLTQNSDSVHVHAGEEPGWLVAAFTMTTEPQYRAVARIDGALRFWAGNRLDSIIQFPKSEAERERARRKAERRRARRRTT
jgi:hypothetical protein